MGLTVLGALRDARVVDPLLLKASMAFDFEVTSNGTPTLNECRIVALPVEAPDGGRAQGWVPALLTQAPRAVAAGSFTARLLQPVGRVGDDRLWGLVDVEYTAPWQPPLAVLPLHSAAPVRRVEWGADDDGAPPKTRIALAPTEEQLGVGVAAAVCRGALTTSAVVTGPGVSPLLIRFLQPFDTELDACVQPGPDPTHTVEFRVGPLEPATWAGDGEPDQYVRVQSRPGKALEKQLQNDLILGTVRDVLGPGVRPRTAIVLDDVQVLTSTTLRAECTIVPNFGARSDRMARATRRLHWGGPSSDHSIVVWNCSMNSALRRLSGVPRFASAVDVVVADYCARFSTYARDDLEYLLWSPLLAPTAVVSVTFSCRANRHMPRPQRTEAYARSAALDTMQALGDKYGYRVVPALQRRFSCCIIVMVFVVQRTGSHTLPEPSVPAPRLVVAARAAARAAAGAAAALAAVDPPP